MYQRYFQKISHAEKPPATKSDTIFFCFQEASLFESQKKKVEQDEKKN
jgi:hypothetical protein